MQPQPSNCTNQAASRLPCRRQARPLTALRLHVVHKHVVAQRRRLGQQVVGHGLVGPLVDDRRHGVEAAVGQHQLARLPLRQLPRALQRRQPLVQLHRDALRHQQPRLQARGELLAGGRGGAEADGRHLAQRGKHGGQARGQHLRACSGVKRRRPRPRSHPNAKATRSAPPAQPSTSSPASSRGRTPHLDLHAVGGG
jgi:hypothetical protein